LLFRWRIETFVTALGQSYRTGIPPVPQQVGWELKMPAGKPGLYANINAKRERIKAGSGEKMRSPGTKGAPSAKDFKESAKTAKKK
jgi:hypothetical protein